MSFKPTLLERLRKNCPFYLARLPDSIRIPAHAPSRPEEVERPLGEATIDDIAFAIQGLEADALANPLRLKALRELHDIARKRGAVGRTTVAEAFPAATSEEAPS